MDNLVPPLIAITDRNESFAAFQMLKESLQKNAQLFPDHLIGWQGGSHQYTVYWLAKLCIWAVPELSPPSDKKGPRHRFWNCFGVTNPANQKMLTITVEINPPHEGENHRLGGMFARDDENHTYIVHTLKVHSGRSGAGPKEFREYLGDWSLRDVEAHHPSVFYYDGLTG
jgi:hypothetical protein